MISQRTPESPFNVGHSGTKSASKSRQGYGAFTRTPSLAQIESTSLATLTDMFARWLELLGYQIDGHVSSLLQGNRSFWGPTNIADIVLVSGAKA